VSTRQCPRINQSLRWIGTELCDPPMYDGLIDISMLVKEFKLQVPRQQRLLALDVVLKVTPTRWWDIKRGDKRFVIVQQTHANKVWR
jgi:hypothetical protein